MNLNDYILTLTSAILKSNTAGLNNKLDFFNKVICLDKLKEPKLVSLGGRGCNGDELAFTNWVNELRKESIKHVIVHNYSQSNHDLPQHILNAFAGGITYILQVATEAKTHSYSLIIERGPSYSITLADVVTLIEAQDQKDKLWERIVYYINDSNSMNQRPVMAPEEIRNSMLDNNFNNIPDYLLSDIISEIQIECIALDVKFSIPRQMQDKFWEPNDSDLFLSSTEPVFLLTCKPFNAEELLLLINAQPSGEKVWEQYKTDQALYQQPVADLLKQKRYTDYIFSLSDEEVNSLSYSITSAICRVCEEQKYKPTIPGQLKDHFESELEHKRASARSNSKRWYLQHNENNWELYFFESLNIDQTLIAGNDIAATKNTYITSLEAAKAFAQKIESPFTEAFALALLFTKSNIPSGNFEKEYIDSIKSFIRQNGFSDRAVEVFSNKTAYLSDFAKMGYSEDDSYNIFSVVIANVFGGMGSWNDEPVDSEDYNTYQQVSSALFSSMKSFFTKLISY